MRPVNSELPLRDIHLPDPVSWWPPAPGWWLLLALVIVLLISTPALLRKLKQKPLNKQALSTLNKIQADYAQHRNNQQLVQQLSILLRRICMSYTSREQSASLTGDAWVAQLNRLTPQNYFSSELADLLITAPYQQNSNIDAAPLIDTCRQWINALPRRYTS